MKAQYTFKNGIRLKINYPTRLDDEQWITMNGSHIFVSNGELETGDLKGQEYIPAPELKVVKKTIGVRESKRILTALKKQKEDLENKIKAEKKKPENIAFYKKMLKVAKQEKNSLYIGLYSDRLKELANADKFDIAKAEKQLATINKKIDKAERVHQKVSNDYYQKKMEKDWQTEFKTPFPKNSTQFMKCINALKTTDSISKATGIYFNNKYHAFGLVSMERIYSDMKPAMLKQVVGQLDSLLSKWHTTGSSIDTRELEKECGGVTSPEFSFPNMDYKDKIKLMQMADSSMEEKAKFLVAKYGNAVIDSTLHLSEKHNRTITDSKKFYSSTQRKKNGVPFGCTVKSQYQHLYMLTHEFGHTILNGTSALVHSKYKGAMDKVQKVYKEYVDKCKSEPKTAFSRYSYANVDEFIAESFCNVEIGETPNPYAQRVYKILQEEFKR